MPHKPQPKLAKRVLTFLIKRKYAVVAVLGMASILLGLGIEYAAINTKSPTNGTTDTIANKTKNPTTPEVHNDIATTEPQKTESSPTAAQPTAPNTTVNKGAPQKTTAPSQPASIPQPLPVQFTAGRISTAYTSCNNGVLEYTMGGADIYVTTPTTQSFTWRIELSDGTIFESSTSAMPAGKYTWFSFPSTPDYPSMIGTLSPADDGDKARLVITSPNYSAGAWSNPVPAGSVASCS